MFLTLEKSFTATMPNFRSFRSTPALRPRLMLRSVLLAAALFTTGGCDFGTTPIEKIVENPRSYEGKEITVKGVVKEANNFIFLKYFVVRDSGGRLIVVTGRMLPSMNSTVKVTGHIEEAFALGGDRVLVLVEKEKR